jgi:hypothetical protein
LLVTVGEETVGRTFTDALAPSMIVNGNDVNINIVGTADQPMFF